VTEDKTPNTTPAEDGMDKLQKAVRGHERWLMIKWLHEKQGIRASMLGPDWVVLYTENGAIDVRVSELAGEE
jgi:hypothetical protein